MPHRGYPLAVVIVGLSLASGAAHADPTSLASAQVQGRWQRLELTFPFLKPLRFSFDADSVPGYEALRLPSFRAESVWWERGSLSLRSYSEVAPALELDCTLTCQTALANTLAIEGRAELGGLSRAVPATYLYARGQTTQVYSPAGGGAMPVRSYPLLSAGFGGLLGF
jgi:hypothetical protein